VSRPDSTSDAPRGVLVRKPKTTIYTVLLGISAGALAIGCLLLAVEIMQYGSLLGAWNIPPGFGK
jgi:hypothetical protein